jgi:uncharacterized membrane protein YuzA (DUF378 family)
MKPVPDDPRFLHVLDPIWRGIKSTGWQDIEIYLIIGFSAIAALLLVFYLLRERKDHS